jgi:ABC-type Fe3+/spermidine/putrescine transport system ATPase subunit
MSPALAKSFSFFADIEMNKINNFFRPEDFKISLNDNEGVKGEVAKAHFMGSHYELEINISGNFITVKNNSTLKNGAVVYVSIIE